MFNRFSKSRSNTETKCMLCFHMVPRSNTVEPGWFRICHDCVRERFELAAKYEHYYPVDFYASREEKASDYPHIVSKSVRDAFAKKQVEYHTLPADRIYCKNRIPQKTDYCNTFVTRRAPGGIRRCETCMNASCLNCAESFPPGAVKDHRCKGPTQEEDVANIMSGQVVGTDYRICPRTTCQKIATRLEGCNEVMCQCGLKYCFKCGAVDLKGHWTGPRADGSRCPRFFD